MATDDGIEFKQVDQVRAKLDRLARQFPNEAARALYQEAEIEMTEAKRRTPVDTGALRSTGVVGKPEFDGDNISVTLDFGGPAAPYAIHVHENLDAFHKVGQAKYLESVILESKPFYAARLARRIELERML